MRDHRIGAGLAISAAAVFIPCSAVAGQSRGEDAGLDGQDICCDSPEGLIVDDEGKPIGDRNGDCSVNLEDYSLLHAALVGTALPAADLRDFAMMQMNFTGAVDLQVPCCDAPLEPLDDGTGLPPGGVPPIIISEIRPQHHIEVFNTTDEDIDLSVVPYQWCAPFDYSPVQANVIVPANGYATLPWPAFLFNPAESAGELILFRDFFFENASSILDFVCWGATSPFFTRKSQAEIAGKWSGSCALPIPFNGAIHRKPQTDGTDTDGYDVTAPPSPLNCAP